MEKMVKYVMVAVYVVSFVFAVPYLIISKQLSQQFNELLLKFK